MADAFPISGQIDPKAFPFLLMDLHRQGATGSLKVEGPSYQKALYYRSGRILFGSSNDPRDQLGAILIEHGKITPEQLEDVNAKVGPGNPLAKVLADSGVVSQRELSDAARAKVERILSDILGYESGSFEFEDGVLPKGAVDLKLSTERLVFAASRRIPERNFVLRHLGGLDVVLARTGDFDAHAAEVASEAGGLPDRLDGRRTLKDAAAATRLDEFEAAKVACALLFLGLVRRVAKAEEQALLVEAPLFVAPRGEASGVDLADTARLAFEAEPPSPAEPAVEATPEPAIEAEAEPPFFTPEAEPETLVLQSEPQALLGAEAEAEPEIAAEEPPLFQPEPEAEPQPEPGEPEPEIAVEPPPPFQAEAEPEPEIAVAPLPPPRPAPEPEPEIAVAPPQRSAPVRGTPPLKPPPPRRAPDVPAPAAASPTRPSKSDLAALDSLLNLQGVEGPLTPLEKSAPRDEPRFGHGPRGGRRARGVNPVLIGAGALLLLAAVGWGVYSLRGGGASTRATSPPARRSPPVATRAAAPPASAPGGETQPAVTLGAAPVASAPVPPVAPATGHAPTPAMPAAAATPASAGAPRPAPPASPVGAPTLARARELLHQGMLPEAASAFLSHVKGVPGGGYSVQILVACSDETVRKALESVTAQELYIVPVSFKGRACYRLCWGLYDTEGKASSAERDVPAYFRKGGAKPKVVPTSAILP